MLARLAGAITCPTSLATVRGSAASRQPVRAPPVVRRRSSSSAVESLRRRGRTGSRWGVRVESG